MHDGICTAWPTFRPPAHSHNPATATFPTTNLSGGATELPVVADIVRDCRVNDDGRPSILHLACLPAFLPACLALQTRNVDQTSPRLGSQWWASGLRVMGSWHLRCSTSLATLTRQASAFASLRPENWDLGNGNGVAEGCDGIYATAGDDQGQRQDPLNSADNG
jgi:hypothetical protein